MFLDRLVKEYAELYQSVWHRCRSRRCTG